MPMKSYESFDKWKTDQPKANQGLIKTMRALIHEVAPDLKEAVKWGNGCFVGEIQPIIYLYSAEDHLQFGFFYATALKDPGMRLQGNGKYIRAVKLRKNEDIDKAYFTKLIKQAVKLEASEGRVSTKTSEDSQGFPESLSQPAVRALKAAGVTTMKKLSRFTEAEILSLHGIGRTSIPILSAALKENGLAFKTPTKPIKKTPLKKRIST